MTWLWIALVLAVPFIVGGLYALWVRHVEKNGGSTW